MLRGLAVVSGIASGAVFTATAGAQAAARTTLVPGLRIESLAVAKKLVASRDPESFSRLSQAHRRCKRRASRPIVSVTQKKTLLPPSGNKHDYFSLSPYWWPDPSKSDGLPYIRRDGETNPESKRDLDQPRVAAARLNVHTLALAWYFTGDEKYAARAAKQLRAWFLDPETRMTPHLRFSQLVRGNPAERGSGIIDTRWFIESVQAAGLISNSTWTAADQSALQQWFREYLTWLRTSPNGAHERAAKQSRLLVCARPRHMQCSSATLSPATSPTVRGRASAGRSRLRARSRSSWNGRDRCITADSTSKLFHAWQKLAALSGSISGVIRRRKAAVFTRRSTMSPATSTVAKSGQARRSTASISRCF